MSQNTSLYSLNGPLLPQITSVLRHNQGGYDNDDDDDDDDDNDENNNEETDYGNDSKEEIGVGKYLPYGPSLYYKTTQKKVRMKDYGMNRRLLVVGVLGAFTPDCWNRHLYLVLKHFDYYKERGVDHVICLSTNDAYVMNAWGLYIGCGDKILMLSDPVGKYTKAMGMDVVVNWLDGSVRCKRFVLLADDMEVKKIVRCERDNGLVRWDCDHLLKLDDDDDDDDDDDKSEI